LKAQDIVALTFFACVVVLLLLRGRWLPSSFTREIGEDEKLKADDAVPRRRISFNHPAPSAAQFWVALPVFPVNDKKAQSIRGSFAEWEISLDAPQDKPFCAFASAEDSHGNVEMSPHIVYAE
jgi:hypothetical protein